MNKILLDTNSYSKLFSATDEQLLEVVQETEKVFLSTIVLGELFFGFIRGKKETQNRALLKKFLHNPAVEVLGVTEETADIYANVMHTLRKKGTPIPTNDIWIAAQAIEHGAVIVTFDTHFLHISSLRVWDKLLHKN